MAAVPSIGGATRVEPSRSVGDATRSLYERFHAQIFGFCLNQLGSREEAEDAVQTTFLNAHRALEAGTTPEAECAWLFKIAHNVCLSRRRSALRRRRVESPSDLDAVQDVLPAPQREESHELLGLGEALSNIPEKQRLAIVLREWHGLSYREIAAELGLTQPAVETLIFRARRSLARSLEEGLEAISERRRAGLAVDLSRLPAALQKSAVKRAAAKSDRH